MSPQPQPSSQLPRAAARRAAARAPQVLSNLTDVRVTTLTGDDAGSFTLTFTFSDNPFFGNKVRRARARGWRAPRLRA